MGGDTEPHCDSTYITTDPLSVAGIWIALDDHTKENGCIWAVPGSHREKPNTFFRINENEETGKEYTYYDPPKESEEFTPYNIDNAIPFEVKAGSIIALHGNLAHYSYQNRSDR